MTPEGKVKNNIKKILKAHDAYYSMPIGTGFGAMGVPDFLVCNKGRFIGIEAKTVGNNPTRLQESNMAHIRSCGGIALVVNEHNLKELEDLLNG